MGYFCLKKDCFLKLLESPCLYDVTTDELYELDLDSLEFLKKCSEGKALHPGGNKEIVDFCLAEGLISIEERPGIVDSPVQQSPVPSLRYLELQITNRCNLRCGHCYLGKPGEIDLGLKEIKNILEELEAMQGLRLLLSGGEPLLHPEFWKINDLLPEFALRSVLLTNGTLLNTKTVRRLNVHEIQVSLDGLEDGHDFLRGKGTFKKALHGITNAKEAGINVSVATMVHVGNLDEFDGLESLLKNFGIRDWTVDVPCILGNLKDNPGLIVPAEASSVYLNYGFGKTLHNCDTENYACGAHLMAVMADGTAAKCAFFADAPAAGNIKDGLRACWQNIKKFDLDELRCDCDMIDECRGGCRYRAFLYGDILGKDLVKCYAYGIIKEKPDMKPWLSCGKGVKV
ncbi:MAG: radical SAM protein [Nitrospirae bacterium]|nr:radical SAM protein [Nitrospirota bacterium]